MEGEVLTGAAPKSLLKKMVAKGLTAGLSIAVGGVVMFFDASPAGAQDDRLKIYGIPEEAISPLSQRLFGTDNTNDLTPEQFQRLLQEWDKQQQAEKDKDRKKRDESAASQGLNDLAQGGCFYHGSCQ